MKPLSLRGKKTAIEQCGIAIENAASEIQHLISRGVFGGWEDYVRAYLDDIEERCQKARQILARPER